MEISELLDHMVLLQAALSRAIILLSSIDLIQRTLLELAS